ncbi:MAG: PBP1A family penicillin-binding protein [Pyrinomonadaceae bacterium]
MKAITVTEDRSFFEHHGINLRGIVRAFVRRYDADPNSPIARQGGSSITQQLVKNLLLTPERTWRRKFAEAYMSLILETRLSKEEIFALYCNEVYLGQRAGFSINGFGEAADSYFNKDVTGLSLPESALLAGLIRSPNRYNPYRHFDTALGRRNQVLDSMAQAAEISAAGPRAKSVELKVAPVRGRMGSADAPYFADYVQGQLSELIADEGAAQHLRIYTTIDLELQRAAYTAVNKQLAALDKIYAKRVAPGTLQAALVAMNAETGEIIAMVGGRDYEKSQLNRATEAMRQPGSVFKPFVYAAALNTAYEPIPRVITPATMYLDAPKTFSYDTQQYSPGNFGDAYSNKLIPLRDALVKSLNVVTVEVAMEVTIGRVMNLATKAGLPRPAKPYPSMALGASEATPLQIASAYTSFAAKGVRATPVTINRITNGKGQTVIAPTTQKNQVMTPEVAFVMTSFMKDVVNRGTAAKLRARGFKANVAGKTGTSRDGWFAGYTPKIVCAVYVGFDNGSQLGLTGSDSALPIWADFMSAALIAHPEWGGDWEMPPGVQQAEIDLSTGMLAGAAPQPAANGDGEMTLEQITIKPIVKRKEYFINNTVPTEQTDVSTEENAPELPEMGDQNGLQNGDLLPPAFPAEPPPLDDYIPAERAPTLPRLEGRGVRQPDGSTRLMGTLTLDIDPATGLIAAATCPVIRSKSFQIGQQPTQYCGPDHHAGNISTPPATRPRLVAP